MGFIIPFSQLKRQEICVSAAIWGESKSPSEETYPLLLLKQLLQQMMEQFQAVGICLALYNESSKQMEMQLHLRLRNATTITSSNGTEIAHQPQKRSTVPLTLDPSGSALEQWKRPSQALTEDDIEDISAHTGCFFPMGESYPRGQDLIGYVWHKNETYVLRHEDYLSFFYTGPQPFQSDIVPTCYLAVPIARSTLIDEAIGRKRQPQILGVIILDRTAPGVIFQQKPRTEAVTFAERIAVYLQNEQLRRHQLRTGDYLRQL